MRVAPRGINRSKKERKKVRTSEVSRRGDYEGRSLVFCPLCTIINSLWEVPAYAQRQTQLPRCAVTALTSPEYCLHGCALSSHLLPLHRRSACWHILVQSRRSPRVRALSTHCLLYACQLVLDLVILSPLACSSVDQAVIAPPLPVEKPSIAPLDSYS